MNAVLVLLMTGVLSSPATPMDRPYLAAEVESLSLSPGQSIEVVGKYQSWMGNCLTLEGCGHCFEVPERASLALLESSEARRRLLLISVRVLAGKRQELRLSVVDAREGPPAGQFFAKACASIDSLPVDRRFSLLNWALNTAGRDHDDAMLRRATSELERALPAAFAGGKLREYLELGHRYLSGNIEWSQSVLQIANHHPDAVSTALDGLGFVKDIDGWRLEEDLLRESGLVREGSRIVTLQTWSLERAVTRWKTSGKELGLLRNLTAQQYDYYIKRRQAKPGMNRSELIRTMGYPDEVTWMQQSGHLWEAWFYDSQETCYLADGVLFSSLSKQE